MGYRKIDVCAMCGEEIMIFPNQKVKCPFCEFVNIKLNNDVLLVSDLKKKRK